MGLKNSLRDLAVACNGDGSGKTLAECIDNIAHAMNPLSKLTVIACTSDDLLGKTAADLQEKVYVKNNRIYGTLLYVNDYTGFSGDETLQSGNYLALYIDVPDEDEVTLSVTYGEDVTTLDSDKIIVIRMNKDKDKAITVTAQRQTDSDFSRTYLLTDIKLETE